MEGLGALDPGAVLDPGNLGPVERDALDPLLERWFGLHDESLARGIGQAARASGAWT